MASTGLLKQFGAGNRKTWTWSAWIKKSYIGGNVETLIAQEDGWNGNGDGGIFINGGYIATYNLLSGTDNGGNSRLQTSARFWDCNAWYHFLVRLDTTQSTENERLRIYVNGVQQTSFTFENYPALNFEPNFNRSTRNHGIGKQESGTAYAFEGSMSHVHFCDGYSYAPTEFGETDATTGEWKIKTSPSVSYGTTGFFILKDGNSVTDQSGNSNNFTVAGGTLTKTEDNPSNVFATGNPLIGVHSNGNALAPTFSNGNNTATDSSSAWKIFQSTLGASSGKYYTEFKQSNDYGTDYAYIGIYDIDSYAQKISGYPYLPDMANCFSILNTNGNVYSGASDLGSYGTSFANGDIIGCAIDLNNNKIYWSKNGVWMNSANPSNGTGGYSITADKTYVFGIQLYNNAWKANFGNGYFGTTAVSSAGTNASGIGIFEYDVPTGFTALSTKGLNL